MKGVNKNAFEEFESKKISLEKTNALGGSTVKSEGFICTQDECGSDDQMIDDIEKDGVIVYLQIIG